MNNIYFTSDTHFGSERTLTLSKRPFSSISEMDEQMIKNWNSKVDTEDIVYHLGDFGNYEVAKRLNGKIILILGNYEITDIQNGKITRKELENIFYEVYDNLTLSCGLDKSLYLVHEPTKCDKNMFNLFGHIHGRQMVKRFGLDVGVDCHHFYPISKDDVSFYKNAILNHYDENVFC